jgi:creatinine amidohydrolase/Fe(II)-dependent formamide hydrolase-like protein
MKAIIVGLALFTAAPLLAGPRRADTVFFEDLTTDEVRDAIKGGAKNVILGVGGTEDAGDQLVAGTPTDLTTYAADSIARAVGNTLVAPVIAYAPGGLVAVPGGKGYEELLEAAATSLKGSGFKNILLLGDGAASQEVLKAAADRFDAAWKGEGVRVFYIGDYFTKAEGDQDRYAQEKLRFKATDARQRSSIVTTSELLAINAQRIRLDKLTGPDGALPTPQAGFALLKIKIDDGTSQIRRLLGDAASPAARPAEAAGLRVLPTPDPRSSGGPSLFLEDLTPAEIRDAVGHGSTVAIIPTGGTEKNGFHMATGKHNFHARAGAELMAKKLGNALVAPVLQYVPEAAATEATPAVLSCARECFEHVVASIARSLKDLGFKEILLVGDNGGNQGGLTNAATVLNKEWEGAGVRAYALTDFYDKGHEYQDAYFLALFDWDGTIVGSHAGIKDTSQMLYVKPQDVRTDRIADSFNNKRESGISGDPTKAMAEFGRIAVEFKANGAIAQYRALKAQAQAPAQAGAGGRTGRRGNR